MLKKNILYNTILQISQLLFPLITFPYAARILQPAALGSVNFASDFTQYFITFSMLGIPVYGIREIAKVAENPIQLKQTFSELFYFNIITTLAISIIFLTTTICIPTLQSDFTLFLIGFGILWSNLFFIEWYFNGIQEFKYITIRSLIIRSISVILIFSLIKSPEDKNLYYLIELIVIAISAICNFTKARHLLILNYRAINIKKHLVPILTIFSLNVMITIYVYANTIILGFFKPKTEVAYYGVSERISKLAIAFIKTSGVVLLPQLSLLLGKKSNEDQEKAIDLLKKSYYFTIFLSIPISFGAFIFSKELIELIAGVDYQAANLSLKILSPLPIILGLAFIYSRQILFPLGKEKQMFKLSVWGMIFNLSINFILIPRYGYIGSSITYLLTEMLMVSLVFWESRKYLKIHVQLSDAIKSVTISLLFIPVHLILGYTNTSATFILLLGIPICGLIYCGIQLWVFKNSIAIELYQFICNKLFQKSI